MFRLLFSDKGRAPDSGQGRLYEKDDFDTDYFGPNWLVVYDKHGDGCSIDFPLRMHAKVQYGPKCYNKDSTGQLVEKPRSFKEIVVTLVKKRC